MPRVQFGFCVPIFAAPGLRIFRTPSYPALDTARTMALARQAETLGYDSIWVADHLMRGKENAILEGWTVLAALAGSTSRVTLGLIHQTHFFRHPALVAKMVTTLDQISNGRFVYFLDCGNQRDEYLAYGLPWDDDIEARVAQMVEGLELTLALWGSREPVTFAGEHFHLARRGLQPRPGAAAAPADLVRRREPGDAPRLRALRAGLEHHPRLGAAGARRISAHSRRPARRRVAPPMIWKRAWRCRS